MMKQRLKMRQERKNRDPRRDALALIRMPRPPNLLSLASRTSKIQLRTSLRCYATRASTSREPTIFAPATGRGKTAISILRVSGPDALNVWRDMTKPPRQQLEGVRRSVAATVRDPPARKAMLRRIVHPKTNEVLDEGIVLYFPGEWPSFRTRQTSLTFGRAADSALTAQPTLELHTHGSPALMELLLELLPTLPGSFRIAEPGESRTSSCAEVPR